ncbi:hypothetical protein OG689_06235 [Kitasatospora sp. NBC_00240]|uniref:hypothetical protein n=1 Tax=Kitasatospora sp. NBC_00240 TaxID=2903567 RepID=UPI00224D88E0|nr:hypothetical protein [Kitasatospora sp. NBC_00240]MCX5208892.1 hypothetical protein [Kitasatospora sp. NBC_00240]
MTDGPVRSDRRTPDGEATGPPGCRRDGPASVVTGRSVLCHDLGLLEGGPDGSDGPGRSHGSDGPLIPGPGEVAAGPPGPAATAAKAVACLALVLAVPLTGAGRPGGQEPGAPPAEPRPAHRAAGPYTDPAGGAPGGDSGDPSGRVGAVELPFAARAAAPSYQGLGMLIAQRSGRRLESGPAQRQPSAQSQSQSQMQARAGGGTGAEADPGQGVVTRAAAAGDAQQWILWPAPGGEVVVQSLPSSGSQEPMVLTVEADGTVGLRYDRSPAGQDETSQLWRFVDRSVIALRADPFTGLRATAFRIRAHQGGCLLDGGAGRSPELGPCEDLRAWWTAQGFYSGTPWGLR